MNNEFKKANEAIDEEMVRNTNNRIKVERDNPALRVIVLLISLIILVTSSFLVFNLSKKYMEGEEVTEVTTTTVNRNKLYLLNTSSVRKLENDSIIIYLLDANTFISLNKTVDSASFIKGSYEIDNDKLIINNVSYEINEYGISSENVSIKTFDSEYKYYRNSDTILLVNATPKKEIFITVKDNEITNNKYTETKENITLDNGYIYEKIETSLVKDGITYNLGH